MICLTTGKYQCMEKSPWWLALFWFWVGGHRPLFMLLIRPKSRSLRNLSFLWLKLSIFEFYLQIKVWDNATICLWWWGLLPLFHLIPFYNAGFKLWMADAILIGILSLQSKDTGLVITYFLYFLSYTCVMRLCISVLFYLFLKLNLDLIYINY